MQILTREQILSADDLPKEVCEIPEWGGSVYVKTLSARAKEEWEQAMYATKSDKRDDNITNIRASLTALTCCDDDGVAIFTKADIEILNEKSSSALERVFNAACKLNRIGTNDVEELAKNSDETHDDDSPTD